MSRKSTTGPAVPGADSPVVPAPVPPPVAPPRRPEDDEPPAAASAPPAPAPSPVSNAVARTVDTPAPQAGPFANMFANMGDGAGPSGAGGGPEVNIPLAAMVGGGVRKDPEKDWQPFAGRILLRTKLGLESAVRMNVFRHPDGRPYKAQEILNEALDRFLPRELTDAAHRNEYGVQRPHEQG